MQGFLLACFAVCALTVLATGPPCGAGVCTPAIDAHTEVDPVPGLRATVEIIPDYGSCAVTYRGYRWYVGWGDGITNFYDSDALMPGQQLYTYMSGGQYNVTVSYCARPGGASGCCENCMSEVFPITVS
eukprot:m.229032 g.229032  ORF g.229032 m.229032 type:complete len:129 (-) comp11840_c0_seq1:58-444(-)